MGRQIREFVFLDGCSNQFEGSRRAGYTDCTDNLNEFTETICSVFPQSSTQICVVHQIRNSCKYVVYKGKKEFTSDMKNIYNAPNKEVAASELDNLEKKWAGKYPLPYYPGARTGMI